MTALVVESDPLFSSQIRTVLGRHGIESSVVRSVTDALRRASETDFDYVISDIVFPGKTGFDLLSRLKNRGTKRPAPICIIYSTDGRLSRFGDEKYSLRVAANFFGADLSVSREKLICELDAYLSEKLIMERRRL